MYGLYLHFPFCIKKCFYCDFYSVEETGFIQKFVDTVCDEIVLRTNGLGDKPKVDSIFFGGGTPSIMTPSMLEKISHVLHERFEIKEGAEWTMECNPGTVTLNKLKAYKENGVNRLSFGIQSFVESELEFLQRIHSPAQAVTAVEYARKAGFDNVSIDLMFAVPGQTIETWKYSIKRGLELDTNHISSYSLIFEPDTPLYADLIKGRVKPTDEDTDAGMYETAIEEYSKAGFVQYEVSNFAAGGKKCFHNLKYWEGYEYYSFGPSAHGFLNGRRYWNYRNLHKYFELLSKEVLPEEGSEILDMKDRILERAFLETRAEGIDLNRFLIDFGLDIANIIKDKIQSWMNEDLMVIKDGKLCLTRRGYLVCDEIALIIGDEMQKEFDRGIQSNKVLGESIDDRTLNTVEN